MVKELTNAPWTNAEWKKKSKAFLEGKQCVQCGSIENLQIHHTYEQRNKYDAVERQVIHELIEKKVNKHEFKVSKKSKLKATCPLCGFVQQFTTKYENGTCQSCGIKFHFDDTNSKIIKVPNYYLEKEQYKQFILQYRTEIDEKMKQLGAEKPDYEDLTKDVIVLCKTCHHALNKGKNLCPVCKKNYKSIEYKTCIECISPERKEQIKEKQDRWRALIKEWEGDY